MNREIYRPIKGYEGLYSVSNLGNIKNHITNTILKPLLKKSGYAEIELYKNKNSKFFLIHRLVADAFIPIRNGASEVNHINGDKADNCVENLEWVTRGENLKHAFETGLRKDDVSPKSIVCFPIENKNKVVHYDSIYKAARALKISQGNICMVCKGHRSSANGFVFRYT